MIIATKSIYLKLKSNKSLNLLVNEENSINKCIYNN